MSNTDLAGLRWREARRERAFELSGCGWSQREIAAALGVSQPAISQWLARDGQDPSSWRNRSRPGAPPKLPVEQLHLLPDLLSHGAEAYGFCGEVWTCARVAVVLLEEFGVRYSRAHVSRLLKALGWTPQMPIKRASQRDEGAVARWRAERWPELQKRRSGKAGALCSSTKAGSTSCLPSCAATRRVDAHQSCGRRAAGITSR